MRLLKSILIKEFLHVFKDPQTLAIILFMPLFMLLLFGYAITLEMREITTIVSDYAHSPSSRKVVDHLTSNGFFKVREGVVSQTEINQLFRRKAVTLVLIIPQDFDRNISAGKPAKLQALLDASDPNGAQYAMQYLNQITQLLSQDYQPLNRPLVRIEPRYLYNPSLRAAYFFVPGLVAVILLLLSALLTSVAIVREKETGTLEQLLVSPVRPFQIIIGKLIPYSVIAFAAACIVLLVAVFWFHVPNAGPLYLCLGMLMLYIVIGLSLGLLISTVTQSQRIAMMITLITTLLPTFLLSGFMFPINSMPVILQWISRALPPTHFIFIIRSIMLKGAGFWDLLPSISVLGIMALVILLICIKRFNMKLE